MKIYKSIIVWVICLLPNLCSAQCHHYSHSHSGHSAHISHSGCHSHAGHYSYHSHHYSQHSGYRDSYKHDQRISTVLEGVHEFSASTGMSTDLQLLDNKVKTATPGYFASYKFYFANDFAMGLSAGTQTISGNDSCKCESNLPGTNLPSKYVFNANATTIAANFTWIYYSKRAFQIYGSADLGVSVFNETDHYTDNTTSSATGYQFNGQIDPLGLRFGKQLGGFVELGFGYKGLVDAGLSYQAGWNKANKITKLRKRYS